MKRREMQKKMSGGWERGSKDDWRRPSKNDRTLGINVLVVLLTSSSLLLLSHRLVGTSALFTPSGPVKIFPLICFFPSQSPFAQLSLIGNGCFLGFILVFVHIIPRRPIAHFWTMQLFLLAPSSTPFIILSFGTLQMKLHVVISLSLSLCTPKKKSTNEE